MFLSTNRHKSESSEVRESVSETPVADEWSQCGWGVDGTSDVERKVAATRIDANLLIDQLLADANLSSDDEADGA